MQKMKMPIIASIFAIALVATGLGMGTMAYFSKTVGAGPNPIMAATIDVSLTCSFTLTDVYPCKDLDPITVTFQNTGPIPGYMYSKITYTGNDDSPNYVNLLPDEFAALIYVTAVTYEHYTKTGGWTGSAGDDLGNWLAMDLNTDGYLSLYEMAVVGWMPYCGDDPEVPLPVGDAGRWVITLHMADSLVAHTWGTGNPFEDLDFNVLDNAPQADGIDLTFTVLLRSSEM